MRILWQILCVYIFATKVVRGCKMHYRKIKDM